MNFRNILMPKVILPKLVSWNHSYLKCALIQCNGTFNFFVLILSYYNAVITIQQRPADILFNDNFEYLAHFLKIS